MGWYSAVGRPLFFALSPETAHRLAGAMLGLPLPWARIGDAVDDPVAGHDRRRAPAPQPDRPRGRLRQDVRPPRRRSPRWASATWSEAPSRASPGPGTRSRGSFDTRPGPPWRTRWVCRTPARHRAAATLARRRRSAGVRVRQRRRRGDRGRARGVRPAGAACRRRRAERELPQRLVGPRPRQRGPSARARDRDARPVREAVVRQAPAVLDRRRARRGPGARRRRAGGRRVRSHVLEHAARA